MKIIIYAPTSTQIDFNNSEQPLGGADQIMIQLFSTLQEKHLVELYTNVKSKVVFTSSSISPLDDIFLGMKECDLLIHYRKLYAIPSNLRYKRAIFYSQDLAETPCFASVQMETEPYKFMKMYDKFIVLSQFHKEDLMKHLKIPEDKFEIVGNFADEIPEQECVKEGLQFIYASTPYRGLSVLNRMWDEIKRLYPEAKLHVFSSMAIYGDKTADLFEFESLYTSLKSKAGVFYHGSVPKRIMLDTMKKCAFLLYPNTYPETFCNVVMEARSCRTPILTSDLGALKETMGYAGFLIQSEPHSKEYQKWYVDNLKHLVDDFVDKKVLYTKLQSYCYPIRTYKQWKEEIENIVANVN